MITERLLNPIKARIRLMVGRALIKACEDGKVNISLLADETREDVDFFQQYGFTSMPKGTVGAVALFVGGSRDNGVVVASRGEDKDMGVQLEKGEVAMHSSFGSSIILKKDGSIVIKSKTGQPVRVEGDVNVVGSVMATAEVAALCVDAAGKFVDAAPAVHLSRHMHASAVGPTSPPTPGT